MVRSGLTIGVAGSALAAILMLSAIISPAGAAALDGAVEMSTDSAGLPTLDNYWASPKASGIVPLFIAPGVAPSSAFINNNASDSFSQSLVLGDNVFTIFASQEGKTDPFFGLNLYFDSSTSPAISVVAPFDTGTAPAFTAATGAETFCDVGADLSARTLNCTPGGLSFVDGSEAITLTQYFFATSSVYGNLELVNDSGVGSGSTDAVGQFTLDVTKTTTVPEPGTLALMAGALIAFGVTRLRHPASPRQRWRASRASLAAIAVLGLVSVSPSAFAGTITYTMSPTALDSSPATLTAGGVTETVTGTFSIDSVTVAVTAFDMSVSGPFLTHTFDTLADAALLPTDFDIRELDPNFLLQLVFTNSLLSGSLDPMAASNSQQGLVVPELISDGVDFDPTSVTGSADPVPEPATMPVLGAALAIMLLFRMAKRRGSLRAPEA